MAYVTAGVTLKHLRPMCQLSEWHRHLTCLRSGNKASHMHPSPTRYIIGAPMLASCHAGPIQAQSASVHEHTLLCMQNLPMTFQFQHRQVVRDLVTRETNEELSCEIGRVELLGCVSARQV